MATLPAPTPRSPPKYPDFYGRSRKQVELQILNREIGFLEEELRSIEVLPPASKYCKEVDDFVATNADPLEPQDPQLLSLLQMAEVEIMLQLLVVVLLQWVHMSFKMDMLLL